MTEPLGRETIGDGPHKVIVLHDWLGDHRNYDPIAPYLDRQTFTYALVDLRGYGLSRDRLGRYDLDEATNDLLALATHLGWSKLHLIGHSMSTLVAQQIAIIAPERVSSLILVAPIAPTGMAVPETAIPYLEKMALDETSRRDALASQWGDRLSPAWRDFKLQRWSQSARPEASKGYVRMFAATALSGMARADLPLLALVGAFDQEPFQEKTVLEKFSRAYPRMQLQVCANAGHYPMQETPVAFATAIDRFLHSHL